MSNESTIQVNFGRPMPIFPLDAIVCMPQQVVPLHVFEPRYRQMTAHVLDGSGQFAVAMFDGPSWKQNYHGSPPIRPSVCIVQIVRHERLADGRYNLLLQGICRAKILKESPSNATRLYREAVLQPIGIPTMGDEAVLDGFRERLIERLSGDPLDGLTAASWVVERAENREIPASALLELATFTLVTGRDARYDMLTEGDVASRRERLARELDAFEQIIRSARAQHPESWPKGCSWN